MNLQLERQTVTKDEAWNLANHWVAAWNSHNLDSIITHYDDAIELTSPVAAQLLGMSDGRVVGKANLRAYFQRGLEAYPDLHFRLEDVLWGVNSVLLYYTNQKGTRTGEFMELSAIGKVARVGASCLAPCQTVQAGSARAYICPSTEAPASCHHSENCGLRHSGSKTAPPAPLGDQTGQK